MFTLTTRFSALDGLRPEPSTLLGTGWAAPQA
jgi:hypothetical protein